jgi:hypothetical protein
MRTTLAIDDDVLAAAKEMAAFERKSVGAVFSALARRPCDPHHPAPRHAQRYRTSAGPFGGHKGDLRAGPPIPKRA